MKWNKFFFASVLFFLSAFTSVFGYTPYCQNLGFELGNFTNWTGYYWTEQPQGFFTPKLKGIVPGRHEIMTDTLAYDPNTQYQLRKIPLGSRYSARIGDAVTNSLEESLSYTLKVDSSNALLIWKFAVVLQDPLTNHLRKEEPRFKVTLFNQKGDTIHDCANYDVYVTDAKITGFQTAYPAGASNPVLWRDWTAVGANLLPYLGQTISIEFMAADCTKGGHYGYAYFVAECNPLNISVKYCTGDTTAILTAPLGFEKYKWLDSKDSVIATSQKLLLDSPAEGEVYRCNLTSASGCSIMLTSTIAKYLPVVDFNAAMVDCKSNVVKFNNLSVSNHGTLTYKWRFDDGTTSTLQHPMHTFATSGLHIVNLDVANPPSLCNSTLTKMVESFSPPLVGIAGETTYCPSTPVTIRGYGAHHYRWSTGETTDSIRLAPRNTKVWMIGYSSSGCFSDTVHYSLTAEPDWTLSTIGRPLFCTHDSTTIKASGANSYRWSTGDTINAITISKPGIYTVFGKNIRGCEKSISLNVVEDPLPLVDFKMSTPTINPHFNKLTCTVDPQNGVQYVWNMGDGTTEMGSTIQHTFANISNSQLDFKIKLTATNSNGCVNDTTKTVDVVPFIPNIFTPNGDGINDVFCIGLELQVFDRNGAVIYVGKKGWDGTFNGRKMDNDTYFYLVKYTDKYHQLQTKKGSVTLVR